MRHAALAPLQSTTYLGSCVSPVIVQAKNFSSSVGVSGVQMVSRFYLFRDNRAIQVVETLWAYTLQTVPHERITSVSTTLVRLIGFVELAQLQSFRFTPFVVTACLRRTLCGQYASKRLSLSVI